MSKTHRHETTDEQMARASRRQMPKPKQVHKDYSKYDRKQYRQEEA
jgi:hypothetical protein